MMNQENIEEIIDTKLSNYFTQFEALQSLKTMFPEAVYFPPTSGWAGSPDFLLKLVELVIIESPRYYFTKLADLKIQMISKDTKDARIRAEK
jgi:hypothetical protein